MTWYYPSNHIVTLIRLVNEDPVPQTDKVRFTDLKSWKKNEFRRRNSGPEKFRFCVPDTERPKRMFFFMGIDHWAKTSNYVFTTNEIENCRDAEPVGSAGSAAGFSR
jgi:hypothetical protein